MKTLLPFLSLLALLLYQWNAVAQGSDHEVTVAAAGDIACAPGRAVTRNLCRMEDTAELIAAIDPDALLVLGDAQYTHGSLEQFRQVYDDSWGRFLGITYPVPGNHEYLTPGAAGYFAYFGERAGRRGRSWYAFDLGYWRVYALDSNCDVVGCTPGSPQFEWLRSELAGAGSRCTLAFFHHPRFSSGAHGSNERVSPLWSLLDRYGVELVLSGHDHHYERFAPMDSGGKLTGSNGLRQFVVGTGGARHYPVPRRETGSEARHSGRFGVLLLTLREEGYAWRFEPVGGGPFNDEGQAACH